MEGGREREGGRGREREGGREALFTYLLDSDLTSCSVNYGSIFSCDIELTSLQ